MQKEKVGKIYRQERTYQAWQLVKGWKWAYGRVRWNTGNIVTIEVIVVAENQKHE